MGILVLVVAGVLPRLTVIPHWWVAWSFQSSAATIEGGDQVAAIVSLLMIPLGLLDSRANHWSRPPSGVGSPHQRLLAWFPLWLIRLQAVVIYFVAGAAKFGENEWQNGTAMYYWMAQPTFGAPTWQRGFFGFLFESSMFVTFATWGVPTLEVFIAAAVIGTRPVKKLALLLALGLHVSIGFFMGLTSFALVMIALDLLYLAPVTSKQTKSGLRLPSRLLSRLRDRILGVGISSKGLFRDEGLHNESDESNSDEEKPSDFVLPKEKVDTPTDHQYKKSTVDPPHSI